MQGFKFPILAMLSVALAGCTAENLDYYKKYDNQNLRPDRFSSRQNVDQFRLENVYANDRIVLPVKIDSSDLLVQLDTGWGRRFTLTLAANKKIRRLSDQDFQGFLNSPDEDKKLGPMIMSLGPYQVSVANASFNKALTLDPNIDGIIGYDLLKYFTTVFDPQNNSITFCLDSRSRQNSLPLLRSNTPNFKINIDGKILTAMIDTGNKWPSTYKNADIDAYSKHRRGIRAKGFPFYDWRGEPQEIFGMILSRNLDFGGIVVHDQLLVATNWGAQRNSINLGMDLLNRVGFTLNYPKMELRFDYVMGSTPPLPQHRLGIQTKDRKISLIEDINGNFETFQLGDTLLTDESLLRSKEINNTISSMEVRIERNGQELKYTKRFSKPFE